MAFLVGLGGGGFANLVGLNRNADMQRNFSASELNPLKVHTYHCHVIFRGAGGGGGRLN